MFKKLFVATVLFSAVSAHASDLSYGYVELGFEKVEFEDDWDTYDGDAINLGLSFALNDTVYAVAKVAKAEVEDVEQRVLGLGLGAHAPISETTDIYAEAGFANVDLVDDNWSEDDNGTVLTLGVRSKLADKFELGGGVTRLDVFDNADNTLFVNGFYYPTEKVAIGAELSKADDAKGYAVNLRVNF